MKNIILLCECGFTRTGLEVVLPADAEVFNAPSLAVCESRLRLWQGEKIDLIILSQRSSSVDALVKLLTLLRCRHPQCKVLFDSATISVPLLRFYLNHVSTYAGVIDFTLSIAALRHFVEQVLNEQIVLLARDITGWDLLNPRERIVLNALMKARKTVDIADALALSTKTVSGYKRSGLGKLGARELQDLVLPRSHADMTGKPTEACQQQGDSSGGAVYASASLS